MNKLTKLGAVSVAATLVTTTAFAEGLERNNISTSFMYEEGNYVEFGLGTVSTDLAPSSYGPAVTAGGTTDVAGDFSVVNLAYKHEFSEQFELGLWYTSQGNGIDVDYGTITAIVATSPSIVTADLPLNANVEAPTLMLMGKYNVSENLSLLFGAKHVYQRGDGQLQTALFSAPGPGPAHYEFDLGSGTGYVIGVGYEIPEIALRAVLTYESEIDLDDATATDTLGGAFLSADGAPDLSVGDAWNLSFQSGIAQNTLLFANIRHSMWENNQASFPIVGDALNQVSDFSDGTSYSLGVARRLNEQWAVSASVFYDPASDCNAASELSPQCENTSLTLGARFDAGDGLSVSFGATYSKRGDVVTDNLGAVFDDSSVMSAGIRIGKSF